MPDGPGCCATARCWPRSRSPTRHRPVAGLLGRDGIEGALLLRPARSVHTLGMRFAIDVAFCDADRGAHGGRHRVPDATVAIGPSRWGPGR